MTGHSSVTIPSLENLEIQITMTSPLARFPRPVRQRVNHYQRVHAGPDDTAADRPGKPAGERSGEQVADDAVGEETATVGEDQVASADAGEVVGQHAVEGRVCRGG